MMERFRRFLKKPLREKIWSLRAHLAPWLPLPIRLEFGMWWLTWYGSYVDYCVYFGRFEPETQKFIFQFLQPGMVAVDIGAHYGFYTLLMACRVGPKGLVIAFEPSPRERQRLKWHVWLNRCRQVIVEPYALADYEGIADLFLRKDSVNNSLIGSRTPFIAKVRVKVTTLDNVIRKHKLDHVDLIKMDVEGAELLVLKGGGYLLQLYPRPVIISEFDARNTAAFGYDIVLIYDFLKNYDFLWFNITTDGRLLQAKRLEVSKPGVRNLVAVPKERVLEIEHLCKQ